MGKENGLRSFLAGSQVTMWKTLRCYKSIVINQQLNRRTVNLTMIGASDMFARAFATWAVASLHNITIVGPGFDKPNAFANDVGAARAAGRQEPLRDDMIILALPYACLNDVLQSYEPANFEGKIVVDLTAPVDFDSFEPIHPKAGSAAQEIANTVRARVVKAFNPMFAGSLVSTQSVGEHMREVFLAGDDDEAKHVVAKLFDEGGLRPIDVGPLRRAQEIEAFAYLHVAGRQPKIDRIWRGSH